MKLTALRRNDGVMMKLTAYDLIENPCPCSEHETKINQFISPHPELNPEPYEGDFDVDANLQLLAHTPRDYAAVLENGRVVDGENIDGTIGFYKSPDWVEDAPEEGLARSKVAARLNGSIQINSVDETIREERKFDNEILNPSDYTATIKGSDTE
jgi:hypothetical protein